MQLVPRFDESRARLAGVTRPIYPGAGFYDLWCAGLYREADKLIPIIARAPDDERANVENLMGRLVWSPAQQQHIPMAQIVASGHGCG